MIGAMISALPNDAETVSLPPDRFLPRLAKSMIRVQRGPPMERATVRGMMLEDEVGKLTMVDPAAAEGNEP